MLFGSNVSVGFSVVSLSLGNPAFPIRYGLKADPQLFGQFRLRDAGGLPKFCNLCAYLSGVKHGIIGYLSAVYAFKHNGHAPSDLVASLYRESVDPSSK